MISIAIISIVTAIVLVKYSSFDSTVLLKSAAYEVALTLREAQIKSVSVVRSASGGRNFDYPYGLSFKPDTNTYKLFQFESDDKSDNPYYDVDFKLGGPDVASANLLQTITMQRSIKVGNICVTVRVDDTTRIECALDINGGFAQLDVAFRRPEFKAIFSAFDADGTKKSWSIDNAIISITSPSNSSNIFETKISNLGQITVNKKE